MKKFNKLLALAIAGVMSLSAVNFNVSAATETTKVFEENFNDWTGATQALTAEQGWSGGHDSYTKIIETAEGEKCFGTGKGAGITKTFDNPYTGMVGVTYTGTTARYYNSEGTVQNLTNVIEMELYDEKTQEWDKLHIQFEPAVNANGVNVTNYLIHLRRTLETGEKCTWHYLSGTTELSDKFDVTMKINFADDSLALTATSIVEAETEAETKTFSFSKNFDCDYSSVKNIALTGGDSRVDTKSYTYDETDSAWKETGRAYATYDNICVYQKDVKTLPALTYLDKDFTDLENDFFGGNNYEGIKYFNSNAMSNKYSAEDETGKSLITFSDGAMNVGYVLNSSDKAIWAMLPLSEAITDGIVELSFKAKEKDAATDNIHGMIKLMSNFGNDKNSELVSLWLEKGGVSLNHQNGSSVAAYGGVSVASGLGDDYHRYKMVINIPGRVINLYIDDVFYGQFGCYISQYQGNNFGYIALQNVVIDDVVVKKAPLLYQYSYEGLRESPAEDEGLSEEWKEQWTQTAENTYGHRTKKTTTDFWYSKLGTKMTISNPTGEDRTVMLISAVYDPEGKLYSAAMSDMVTLNKKDAEGNGTEVTTLTAEHTKRMAASMASYSIKTFVFDSITGLTPIYNAIEMPHN